MTRNRARKTATRERMATTGEPYTAARRKSGPPVTGPYPPGTQWTFHNLRHPTTTFRIPLHYQWEPDGGWITDDYDPEDISARQLWDQWVKQVDTRLSARNDQARPGDVIISWYVTGQGQDHGVFEGPPFELPSLTSYTIPENFSTFFSTPLHAETGEPINWLRLPVLDLGWNSHHSDKGGFVQEVLGWKPSPLQPTMNVRDLARIGGLS
ncbi:hypothetical protein [Kitasatospora sp. NPDC059599]|uniref:hypothetical protein n=1 Tax=Kitasatospora sp. NPDC059599 TaxID=3346880 RepID=UPI0036A2526B